MKLWILSTMMVLGISVSAQWTILNVPTSGRYDDVFFINEDIGWAADGQGQVLKTMDAGQTWSPQLITDKYLRSIEFLNDQVGFCGSLDSSLYKTTDGGTTWVDIANTITPKPPGICGLSAPGQQVIYGCGAWFSPAYVIKSSDGGTTWTSIDLSQYATSLVDIHFIDEDHGFVSGQAAPLSDGGIVLYTADGGQTWEVKHKTYFPQDYIWKLQTPDGVHFFGAVESTPSSENVRMIKSADAGVSWETVEVNNSFSYIQCVGFLNPQHGWIGGNNTLYETLDGGDTWSEVFVGSTYNRFFKVNDYTAYLTGMKIYKFVDGDAGLPDVGTHDDLHILRAFPNPVEGQLTIDLTLADDTRYKVELIDATGKQVCSVFDGYGEKGSHQFVANLSELKPQVLFLIVRSNEGTIYREIIVK